MMDKARKIDCQNFDATIALTIAAWRIVRKFMYGQATPETRMLILQALDDLANNFVSRGVIYAFKSRCYSRNDQIVFEIVVSETLGDVFKPKTIEICLN